MISPNHRQPKLQQSRMPCMSWVGPSGETDGDKRTSGR